MREKLAAGGAKVGQAEILMQQRESGGGFFAGQRYPYRWQLRFGSFALRRAAVRDGLRCRGRNPSQLIPASGPRARQFDTRTCTSTAAASRCSAAAKEAEESPAAAVGYTSALRDALHLAAGVAHAWAVLLQLQQLRPRRLVHDLLLGCVRAVHLYSVARCCCGTI